MVLRQRRERARRIQAHLDDQCRRDAARTGQVDAAGRTPGTTACRAQLGPHTTTKRQAAHADSAPQDQAPPPVSQDDSAPWADALDAAEEREREPAAEPPEPDNPFTVVDEPTLRRLHQLGRQAHGEDGWRQTGPERIQAHSDGRTSSSAQLSHPEAVRLINELTAQLQKPAARIRRLTDRPTSRSPAGKPDHTQGAS